MGDPSYGNAMTEVALALAMAFFSIMVLTTVSMSAAPRKINLTVQKKEKMEVANSTKEKEIKTNPKKKLIIFWEGRFLDRDLKPLDLHTLEHGVPIVLAMSPDLKMSKVLSIRTQFASHKTLVSALDPIWLERLHSLDDRGR